MKSGGNYATLAGGYGATLAGGANSVIVAGNGSVVRAGLGSLIVIYAQDTSGTLKEYKAAIVDGENIKADTAYKLENGKFVEVKRKED